MFSISQTSSGFYCIEWSPTENGPKIVKHKHLRINNSIEEEGILKQIISSFKPTFHKDSKSLSITLNLDKFLISQIKCDTKISSNNYIQWYEENFLSSEFKNFYDIYYFPLLDNISFLTLSINKKIKSKLLNYSSELGYNLIYLSADIFSSSTLLKQINNDNNFLIWKIGKNNYHYLLNIVDSKICSFVKYKKRGNKLTEFLKIGSNEMLNKMSDFLNSVLIENKVQRIFSNVYVYHTTNSNSAIKKILSINDSNIKLFEMTHVFDKGSSLSSFKCNNYVENGISFRGLDV